MARLKNDLFRFLVNTGVFKDNGFYDLGGVKLSRASERTEMHRRKENRVKHGIYIPIIKGKTYQLGKQYRRKTA
jgi:hypothetical protein